MEDSSPVLHGGIDGVVVVVDVFVFGVGDQAVDEIDSGLFRNFGGLGSDRVGARVQVLHVLEGLGRRARVFSDFDGPFSLVEPESERACAGGFARETLGSRELFRNEVMGRIFGVCVNGEVSGGNFYCVSISESSEVLSLTREVVEDTCKSSPDRVNYN